MPHTKAISPVSNSYLTKGKEYEIIEWVGGDDDTYFIIVDDDSEELLCENTSSDPHLNKLGTQGLSWQLK